MTADKNARDATGRIVPRLLLLALSLLLFSLTACDATIILDELPVEPSPIPNTTRSGEWYEIYFTNPSCPPEEERYGGIDEIIAEDLLQAQRQVDVAAFDLDAEPIVNALIALEQQGKVVRVVTDDENEELGSIRRLRRNGISVVTDNRTGLMHNKFIVIDQRYVWTGSLNYTSNGAYCNNNNVVRIDSPELAGNFSAELDEMYFERSFGPTSPDRTLRKSIRINGVRIDNYFASEEEIAPIIARLVETAEQEILVMAFSFTHEEIGEAILAQAAEGVAVRGVFESVGSQTPYSYYGPMAGSGLPTMTVRQDGNPRIMHHKVIIIDRKVVLFGSFNFTANANDNNDENVLVVHDEEFAGYFVEEFEFVWEEARS
jgi:phosphatidylserine/phosphatidylglycerophosphate/cardiolipin synthase-like enzyme